MAGNPFIELAGMLEEMSIAHDRETADGLDALRVRLGREGLSIDEWNALVNAAMSCRLQASRREAGR